MTRGWMLGAFALLAGCVLVVPVDRDGNGNDRDRESLLEVSPSTVQSGLEVLTIFSPRGDVDLGDVDNVRSIGDFDVLEFDVLFDEVEVVIDVYPDAFGQQTIALDLPSGSFVAHFDAR